MHYVGWVEDFLFSAGGIAGRLWMNGWMTRHELLRVLDERVIRMTEMRNDMGNNLSLAGISLGDKCCFVRVFGQGIVCARPAISWWSVIACGCSPGGYSLSEGVTDDLS